MIKSYGGGFAVELLAFLSIISTYIKLMDLTLVLQLVSLFAVVAAGPMVVVLLSARGGNL
jgi:hypothetical protein